MNLFREGFPVYEVALHSFCHFFRKVHTLNMYHLALIKNLKYKHFKLQCVLQLFQNKSLSEKQNCN